MSDPAALVRRAGRARPAHAAIIVRTIAWLLLAKVLMATRGFRRVRALLRMTSVEPVERGASEVDPLTSEQQRSLVWAFRVLDALKPSCLPRSIVLERVCVAAGIHAEIVIGVVTNDGFRAHAWVEAGGRTLRAGEQGTELWKPLARFESAKARALR